LSYFFYQAEDGIRDRNVTGVQTCALPISTSGVPEPAHRPISPPCTAPSGDIAASGASRHSSSTGCGNILAPVTATTTLPGMDTRSEERRVGKECGSQWRGCQ